jgi:hypothetical protein
MLLKRNCIHVKKDKTEVRMNKAKKYFEKGYGVNGYALPFLTPLALY